MSGPLWDSESATDDMFAYCSQISLRKTLNRTHNLVYGPRKEPVWEGWGRNAGPKEMLSEIEGLRDLWTKIGRPDGIRQWTDDNPTSEDINVSRVRGKYYGTRYLILRPFLQHAMYHIKSRPIKMADISSTNPAELPLIKSDTEDSAGTEDTTYTNMVIAAAKACIDAAMLSTVAFDGLKPNRFLITNIHGTALA